MQSKRKENLVTVTGLTEIKTFLISFLEGAAFRARAIAIIPIIRGDWDYAPKAQDYATLHTLYRDYRDYAVGIT